MKVFLISIQNLADDVFLEIEPVIKSVIDGYNACIFAYGQTGTGKTYTMVRRINQNISLVSLLFLLSLYINTGCTIFAGGSSELSRYRSSSDQGIVQTSRGK